MTAVSMPEPPDGWQPPDHIPDEWLTGTPDWPPVYPAPEQVPLPAPPETRIPESPAPAPEPSPFDGLPDRKAWKPMPAGLRRLYSAFNFGMQGIALYGQIPGTAYLLHGLTPLNPRAGVVESALYYAPGFAAGLVLEFVATVLLRTADWRHIERNEKLRAPYIAAGFIALLVAGLNLYSHLDATGPLFAGASLVGFGMYMWLRRLLVADALREKGELVEIPDGTPRQVAERAKELARRHPGYDSWVYVEQAGKEIDRERRHAAVRAVITDEFRKTGSADDAELAIGVLDMDKVARDLARSVDYRKITGKLADRLTAERIAGNPGNPETGARKRQPAPRKNGNQARPETRNTGTGGNARKETRTPEAGKPETVAPVKQQARAWWLQQRDQGAEPSGAEVAEFAARNGVRVSDRTGRNWIDAWKTGTGTQ